MPKQGAPVLLYSVEYRQYTMCVNFYNTEADWGPLLLWPDVGGSWIDISPDDLWAYAAEREKEPE
jgi:hypothetical protein